MRGWILCGWLLAADPSTVEEQVEHARVLIRDLHEEQALSALKPLLDDPALPATLRARALIYAGIASLNLANTADAQARFRAALDADPGATLPDWVSRKIRSLFDAVLDEQALVAAPRPVRIEVEARQLEQAKPTPRPHPRLMVGFFAGAVVAAGGSVASFLRWRALHLRASREPEAVAARQVDDSAKNWWYVGEAAATASLVLASAGMWTWQIALEQGGASATVGTRF